MITMRSHRTRVPGLAPLGVYLAPILMLIFPACGSDPILERAQQEPDRPSTAPSSGGLPPPGIPAEPPPGVPAEPTPVGPGGSEGPQPGIPAEPTPVSPGGEGPQLTLSGVISLSLPGPSGPIRIDVFDGDQRDLSAPRPKVVGMVQLDQPGPFTVQVPASAQKVWIGAYADKDQNGRPDPQDPAGWFSGNPVDLSGATLPSLTISLAPEAAPPSP